MATMRVALRRICAARRRRPGTSAGGRGSIFTSINSDCLAVVARIERKRNAGKQARLSQELKPAYAAYFVLAEGRLTTIKSDCPAAVARIERKRNAGGKQSRLSRELKPGYAASRSSSEWVFNKVLVVSGRGPVMISSRVRIDAVSI